MDPLMEKYIKDENYYFINEQGKKTFNSGQVMLEESEVFHPLIAPFTTDAVVGFFVDDAPLIYCDSRLDEDSREFMSLGWDFVYNLNKDRFFNSEGKEVRTEFLPFESPKSLDLPKKEVVT
tara:strand:- start:1138 stop:1500 length:363 start_codon:yes stop_codon:yes gene_type:complete